MGDRIGEQDGYPAGVSNAHPHFHNDGCVDYCPACGGPINDDVYCPHCDEVLDEDEAMLERADHVRDELKGGNG